MIPMDTEPTTSEELPHKEKTKDPVPTKKDKFVTKMFGVKQPEKPHQGRKYKCVNCSELFDHIAI